MQLRILVAVFAAATLSVWVTGSTPAAPPATKPVDGLRDNTPRVFALRNARIVIAPGQTIESGTVVVRDGVITAVGAEVEVPGDARVVDLAGKTVYPGLIDAFSEFSAEMPTNESGAPHWNPQVRPQLDVAKAYNADSKLNETLRGQGIVARLIAPKDGVIKGTSAVVTTGDDENSRAILRGNVAQHVRLTVPFGSDRNQFPNSPMGAVALARQTLYDARWYGDVWAAYRADRRLERPERNDALAALAGNIDGGTPLVIDTSNELFVLRADRFAREFGLKLIVLGSGNEYRRLEAIRATGRAIIVPVNFPQPPNVATVEAARNVTLEQMLHWDHAPENAARLDKAGVAIALTSHGLKDQSSFLANVRIAVARGLSRDSALRALTTTPAELLGVSDRLGTVEAGKAANLVVMDGDLFDEKTKVFSTWIDGRQYEVVKPPLFDIRGTWDVELAQPTFEKLQLKIKVEGTPDKLTGKVILPNAKPDEDTIELKNVGLRDARFSCTFDGALLDREGTARLTAVVEIGADDQAIWTGHIVWPDGSRAELSAVRSSEAKDEGAERDEKNEENKEENSDKKPAAASFAVNFPLGSFGRDKLPAAPNHVLFRNATIWTCDEAGIVTNGSLLIGDGKILEVGTKIAAPDDAIVVDCKGKHISPGIIDCHSHMATDGGINESGQAVTAEVRIGDFIDCDDIEIYRQLAGGVTSVNVLHGSANPIGGQNQVLKLRWGALDEEMKFADAPAGIKFALGENVKQSNWGDDFRTRYPQSRMGVEQLIRDEFAAARRYHERWDAWHRSHEGLPPRRDLELDAVSEILAGDRWIHCHSYRQDEILALLRTCDEFGVRIGTLQHILEGYKVADAMAQHGAMGSSFADWWAYKFEVYDAIPFNGALMHDAGVVVSFNSDDRELARHLNHEAAKAIKYGGVEPIEALKFVTLNPAKQLRIDRSVGSLAVGKHADLVVWSGPPLSTFSRCEQTWVDGRKYFDRDDDAQARAEVRTMRTALIQKILDSGEKMSEPDDESVDPASLWPRHDEFCHRHGHDE